ncbi:MAG: hypothetical protein AAF799_43925 [Myxococcota bacterium]
MGRLVCSSSLLAVLVLATGCPDDVVTQGDARLDVDELADGVTVEIEGALGTVELPFELPVPEVGDEEFETEMERSVSLFIASDMSGAAADLAVGTPVDGTPAAPGEFAWSLDEDRELVTLTFFNESPGGLTLKPGRPYSAQLSVTSNRYVLSVAAISFAVTVTGG